MEKTLKSGLKVNNDNYYKLLEWKDTHPIHFEEFMRLHGYTTMSVNDINVKSHYDRLLTLAMIKT